MTTSRNGAKTNQTNMTDFEEIMNNKNITANDFLTCIYKNQKLLQDINNNNITYNNPFFYTFKKYLLDFKDKCIKLANKKQNQITIDDIRKLIISHLYNRIYKYHYRDMMRTLLKFSYYTLFDCIKNKEHFYWLYSKENLSKIVNFPIFRTKETQPTPTSINYENFFMEKIPKYECIVVKDFVEYVLQNFNFQKDSNKEGILKHLNKLKNNWNTIFFNSDKKLGVKNLRDAVWTFVTNYCSIYPIEGNSNKTNLFNKIVTKYNIDIQNVTEEKKETFLKIMSLFNKHFPEFVTNERMKKLEEKGK